LIQIQVTSNGSELNEMRRQKGSCKEALGLCAIKMFIFLADLPLCPTSEEEKAPSPPPVPALKTDLEPASTEVRAY